jgi:hypothetical protein
MDRIFRFEMAVKTGLIAALVLAVIFVTGCPKKQDKSVKTPPPSVSNKKATPKNDIKEQPSAAVEPVKPVENKQDTVIKSAKEVAPQVSDKENKAPQQLPKPTAPEPTDLKSFESLNTAEEKIDFITEYADEHPESEALMVYKVLDDNDAEVRTAAMEMLAMKELDDPNVLYVAAKALKDSEQAVRQSAVEACTAVTDPGVGDVLNEAIKDSSEEVRTIAVQVADQKEPAVRLSVLKSGITSQYEDVKENAVSSLIDASTPEAVDILIMGLKDPNPDFRDSVKSGINFLVSQEFDTYDQAVKWWNANRDKFDNELMEKQ